MNAELQQLIAAIFSLTITALGLSYLFRTRHWARLYRDFEQHPRYFIPTGLLMFVSGLFVAIGVNDWSSTWPIFITACGWLMALEAGLLLVNPALVSWMIRRIDERRIVYLRMGGLLLTGLGGLLTWEYLLQGMF